MQLQLNTAVLNARCEEICTAFFGQPSQRNQFEMRWGAKGSFALRLTGPKRGFFFDHEVGKGGDMLTLIGREHGVGIREALEIAQRDYLGASLPVQSAQLAQIEKDKPAQVGQVSEDSKRKAALRMFDEGRAL